MRLVTCQLEPVDEAYWTLHPATLTGCAVRLNSSMKSFLIGAPLLPPPPYTWLMTTVGPTIAGATSAEMVGEAGVSGETIRPASQATSANATAAMRSVRIVDERIGPGRG